MTKLSDLAYTHIYPEWDGYIWPIIDSGIQNRDNQTSVGDFIKGYQAVMIPPSKSGFLEEKIDSLKNSVVLEFLLAGYEKHEISIKVSKEKQQIIISKAGLDVPLIIKPIPNRKDLDISDKISSVLKNGILTISIPILEKEKDLEVKIQ
jgi:HSP20 family molecular chaperone IbpA